MYIYPSPPSSDSQRQKWEKEGLDFQKQDKPGRHMFCEKGRSYQDQAQCQTQRFKDSADASLIPGAQSNEGKETKCVDTKYV